MGDRFIYIISFPLIFQARDIFYFLENLPLSMTTSIQWFLIVIILFTIWVIALSIANVVYYNRIRTGGIVQSGEAAALVWISVLTIVVAFVIFCVTLWYLFSGRTSVCAPPPTATATVVTPPRTTTYTVTTPTHATQVKVPVTTAPAVTTAAPSAVVTAYPSTAPVTVYAPPAAVTSNAVPVPVVVGAPTTNVPYRIGGAPSFTDPNVATAMAGLTNEIEGISAAYQ